jgi:hypothetical protein
MVDGQIASRRSDWHDYLAAIVSLVLAGERDRAAEYVQKLERETRYESDKAELRARWERMTKDVDAFCAKMHAQEAEHIKVLKLEKIWEPCPFPVELPPAERARSPAEPVFLTTPWIARPPGLWQGLPTEPGDVRFAKDLLRRGTRVALPAALTREEAEVRHHAGESYVLAARLPDGLLLIIQLRGWDRNNPWTLNRAPTPSPVISFLFELYGESRFVRASTSFDRDGTGVVPIYSVEVYARPTYKSVWHCSFDREEDVKRIWDSRSGEEVFSKLAVTPAEWELVTCPIPAFGEYAAVAGRVQALLQTLGYGDVT